MIITIDGPAGTGKSTVAKLLAEKIGFSYIDTGAMYRAITYSILKNDISFKDIAKISDHLSNFRYHFEVRDGVVYHYVNDEDVTSSIRSQEITSYVSQISAYKEIRDFLVKIQREVGSGADAVLEGRDIGSVVFPNAEIKIFLDALPEIRAERRYLELLKAESNNSDCIDKQAVLKDILRRDKYDSSRKISPLICPDDAYVIDTSTMSIDDVVDAIKKLSATFF